MRNVFVTLALLALVFQTRPLLAEGPDADYQWEGAFEYAIVGGTVLADECVLLMDPNTEEVDCYDYDAPEVPWGTAHDNQGDAVINWPNGRIMDGIPEDAQVEQAFLVWMASVDTGAGIDTKVRYQPPFGQEYVVDANPVDDCDMIQFSRNGYSFKYSSCMVDITETMRKHVDVDGNPLNAWWNFGDMDVSVEPQYRLDTTMLGAWAAVIIYRSPGITRKRLYLYKDFTRMQCGRIALTPAGFETPAGAEAKITYFVGEGDEGVYGTEPTCPAPYQTEGLFFNGTQLSDANNPADNPYNSTRSTNVIPEVGCETQVYSLDLDTYDVSSLLSPGDTSATVWLDTGRDVIFSNFLMVSIDTKPPSFDIPDMPEKTCSVPDDGFVSPGDAFEYTITVQNHGEDVAFDVTVQDEIPQYTKYVCNSTYLKAPDGSEQQIPDRGSCICPLTGEGITIASRLDQYIVNHETYEVRFSVTLLGEESGVTKETLIYNDARINSSNGFEAYVTNGGIPVRLRVQPKSYEGKLTIDAGAANTNGGFVFPGSANVPLSQMKLTVTEGDVYINTITLDASGTADDAAAFTALKLYWDNYADGAVSDGDELVDTTVFASDNGRAGFTGIYTGLNDGDEKHLLLVADIASGIPQGADFTLKIDDFDGLDLRGFIASGSLPWETGKFMVPDEDLLVSLGPQCPRSGAISPGQTFVAMQVAIAAQSEQYNLPSATFNRGGNIVDAQLTGLSLYLDADGNGDPSGDTLLGETTFASGAATISGMNVTIPGGDTVLLLAQIGINSTVATFGRVSLTIPSGGLAISGSAGAASMNGLPLEGPEFTVEDGSVTDGDSDVIVDGDTTDGWDSSWPDGDEDTSKRSSDGGCAGGFTAFAAAILGLLAIVRRRR